MSDSTLPRVLPPRSAGVACLVGAIMLFGLLLPAGAPGQQPDAEMLSILADMVRQQHQFKSDRLDAMGVSGLSALLDYLLPETARPKPLRLPAEAVGKLIEQLGSKNYRVRESASGKLHQLGPAVKPWLVEAARSDDAEVAWRARRVLGTWQAELRADRSRYVHGFAVYVGGIQDDQRLKELLRRTITSLEAGAPQPAKQQMLTLCISAIARAGKEQYTDQFKPLLNHEQVQVAVLVTQAVASGAAGSGRFPSLLLEALRADREEVVTPAINATLNCTDPARKPEVKRLLADVFEGDNERLKLQACTPLIQSYDYGPARRYLIDLAASGDRSQRFQALRMLRSDRAAGTPADKEVLEVLSRLLEHEDKYTRREACSTLAGYSGEGVVEKLIPLLADSYSSVRVQVERCLQAQSDKKMVRRLVAEAAKAHPDEKVRSAAAATLRKLGQ